MHSFCGHWVHGTGSTLEAGLQLKRLSVGAYEVKKAEYAPPCKEISFFQVAFDSPWSSDMTLVFFTTCSSHNSRCSKDTGECSLEEVTVPVPRWQALGRPGRGDVLLTIEVYEFAKCETLEEAKRAPPPILSDAGFFVQVMVGEAT